MVTLRNKDNEGIFNLLQNPTFFEKIGACFANISTYDWPVDFVEMSVDSIRTRRFVGARGPNCILNLLSIDPICQYWLFPPKRAF